MGTKRIAALISDVRAGINRFLAEELKRHGIGGLAPSHGAILFHLFAHEAVNMKDLARAVRRDKSTVTALVGKLVASGYVQKEGSPDDRRSVHVRLTRKGQELKPVFEAISDKLIKQAWRGIGEAEQQEVIRFLKKIGSNFT